MKNVYAASLDNDCMLLGSRAIAVYAEGNTKNEAYHNCESKNINKKEFVIVLDISYYLIL